MKTILKDLLKQYFLPRWIVLLYDLLVISAVFIFTTYLTVNFSLENVGTKDIYSQIFAIAIIFFGVYLLVKPHYNIIRHTTTKDFAQIVSAHIIGSISLCALSVMYRVIFTLLYPMGLSLFIFSFPSLFCSPHAL
jgi:hypothetical protein